ncbi:hypothetical protein [Prosthecobacter sp.]|jgi:hypothetical protein|uniref:hypothetical protein n=1 Tax=Prosthecobacter sp. TaxID=1965333 RepID=UPI0037842480
MESLAATVAFDPAFSDFQVQSFGSLVLPDHPIRFGFQVDIVPESCPKSILFGLINRDPVNGGTPKTTGFAVRVELEMREVWDVLNGSGLVGWVEHPLGLAGFTDEEPLLLGWEIEFHGQALIPKLVVADQQWLYPAIQCPYPMVMESLVGWQGEGSSDPRDVFLHPALWREQIPILTTTTSETLAAA